MSTTNTLDLNNRVDKLEKAVSGGDSAQANKTDIATEFSATTNYTAGCFVYHDGKLYQFNADHSAGAWDSTDVVEANVTDEVTSNTAAIDALDDRLTSAEGKITDSGWLNPSSDIYYRKKNGYVTVKANYEPTASLVWEAVYTLPEGYRPTEDIILPIYNGDLSKAAGRIQTNGNITVIGSAGVGTTLYTTFPID